MAMTTAVTLMTTEAAAISNASSMSPNETNFNPQDSSITSEMLLIFICLGLLALLIVFANSLVFYLALVQPKLRSKTNYFLISLAASDLFSGLLGVPLLISCNMVHDDKLCLGMDICQRFLSISSILHLFSAVMERYLKISRPFRHNSIVTKTRLITVTVFTWASSLTAALVQIAWDEAENMQDINLVYSGTLLLVFVLVPYVCSLAAFVLMYKVIKRGEVMRKQMTRRRANSGGRLAKRKILQQKRVLVVYISMVTCFTVGWFPYFFLTLFVDLGHEFAMQLPFWLNVTLLFLKYSTSLANPLLFTFFKADFQKALKNVVLRPWRRVSETDSTFDGFRNSALNSRFRPNIDKMFERWRRSRSETQI